MYFIFDGSMSVLPGAERSHWLRYDENMATRHEWATQLLNSFRDDVRKIRSLFTTSQPNSPSSEHPPSHVSNSNTTKMPKQSSISNAAPVQKNPSAGVSSAAANSGHQAAFQAAKNTKLLENSVIVRLEDIIVHQVRNYLCSHAVITVDSC